MSAPPATDVPSLEALVAYTSLHGQLYQLRLVIRLSMAIVAALDVGDHVETRRLSRLRDEEYRMLDGAAAIRFRDWPKMSKEELDALLATGGAPS